MDTWTIIGVVAILLFVFILFRAIKRDRGA